MSTPVTLTGRLAKDPEVRYSAKGQAVARFTVMTSRRIKDKQTGEWSDADTSFWHVVAFGQLAENAAESLEKAPRSSSPAAPHRRSGKTRKARSGGLSRSPRMRSRPASGSPRARSPRPRDPSLPLATARPRRTRGRPKVPAGTPRNLASDTESD